MANSSSRWRFISHVATVAALTFAAPMMLSNTTAAQGRGTQPGAAAGQGRGGRGGAPAGPSDTDTRPYNKHDFNGMWTHNPGAFGLPACPECAEQNPIRIPGYGYFGDVPPRTPEGEQKLQMTKHGRGFEPDSEEAKKILNLDPAYKRAGLPAYSNDPEARCEMMGLARSIVMGGPDSDMEMFHSQANDRITHNFEWYSEHRDIWLDGRPIPKPGELLPRVNGYSVGRWEGDTLVVTSTGFDDRQWVDMYGFPISESAVLVERWERPSPNRLRVQLTLTDPVNYTRPWTSTVKTWTLVPKEKTAVGGWGGLFEHRCIPSDEAHFNEFRDHAAGLNK
jgi:hypothetical protein